MGDFIILMLWGIIGRLLTSKEEMQRLMQEEAEAWWDEQNS